MNNQTTKISPTLLLKIIKVITKKREFETLKEQATSPDNKNGNSAYFNGMINLNLKLGLDTDKLDTMSSRTLLKKVLKNVFTTSQSMDSIKKLFPPLKKIIDVIIPNLGVRRGYYSEIRSYLKENEKLDQKIINETFKKLSISREEAQALQQQANTNVIERNRNQTEIDTGEIVRLINELKRGNMYERIMVIQMCCGLRFNEVLVNTTFTIPEKDEIPDELKNVPINRLVKLSNLSKSHGRNARSWVVNPIMVITFSDLQNLVYYVRNSIDTELTSKKEITARYNQGMNKVVKNYFEGKSSHFLRKIYGTISYEQYCPRDMGINVWLNERLGHTENSLGTSANYSTISVNRQGGNSENNKVLETRIDKVEEDVSEVKEDIVDMKKLPVVRQKDFVIILNEEGDSVKIPVYHQLRDGKSLDRALKMLKFLHDNHITTYLNKHLREIGFSARIAGKALEEWNKVN